MPLKQHPIASYYIICFNITKNRYSGVSNKRISCLFVPIISFLHVRIYPLIHFHENPYLIWTFTFIGKCKRKAGSFSKCFMPQNVKFKSKSSRYNVHNRAVGRSENSGVPVLFVGHNLPPPLVEIGLRWLPKLGVDMSSRPHAHRRA